MVDSIMQFEYDPERLIDEIKQRPGIWKYSDPNYKIMTTRLELWNEVVSALLEPDVRITKSERRELVLQLQKKWKGIKDAFQKYIQNPLKTKRPYIYYKHLQFLLKNDNIRARVNKSKSLLPEIEPSSESEEDKTRWKRKKSITVKNEDMSSEEEIENGNDNDNENDNENDDDSVDAHYLDTALEEYVAKKAKKAEFAFANVDSKGSESNNSEDCDKLFLLSLLPHFKTIPEESKLDVKMQLLQVLQKAQNDKSNRFM